MTKDNEDIWRKLQEMDNKLDNIDGNLNILSTSKKQESKGDLQKLFKRKFGRSDKKRLVWYYADEPKTVDELSELVGTSESYIRNMVSDMNALLDKHEVENNTHYTRSEISVGIDLETHVEDFVDEL